MNKENYKAIAEIIKIRGSSESPSTQNYRKFLSLKLADYFEKEELEERKEKARNELKLITGDFKFNRKQFLKDCGVDEDE